MKFSHLPNLITISRIALAPVLILVLKDGDYAAALVVFAIAGLSDGLDGWIAKRFKLITHLGAVLDPLADKILLISAYVMLAVLGHLPFWLVLAVVFRDLLIIGGYLLYTSMAGAVRMHPSRLSKFNTVMQIVLVIAILGHEAAGLSYPILLDGLIYAVLVTTVASGAHYLWIWIVMKDIRPALPKKRPHA